MRTLVIECATEACSVALFDNGALIGSRHRVLGRGHAEHLIPMIAELPGKGRADLVAVSLGPGSFTGVRIGIAAARALGVAWSAAVTGYPTLALVAAVARSDHPGQPASIAMTGGHGEWFVNNFNGAGMPGGADISLPPQAAAEQAEHAIVAGTRAEELVAVRGHGAAVMIHPDARCFPLIPPALLQTTIKPNYGRSPDAKLPAAKS